MSAQLHLPRRQIPLGFTPELYPEGTHICYLYSDEEERKRFMSAFVASGIGEHESVTYLADTPSDTLDRAIDGLGIAAPPQHEDQLRLAPALDIYCPGGHFVPEKMLDYLRSVYTDSPADCAGARLAAEMTWALHDIPGVDRLVEYEGRISDVLQAYPLTTLCQYDTRKFDGATIFELLNVHPIMIVHGQIMRNPFYVPPERSSARKYGTRDDK